MQASAHHPSPLGFDAAPTAPRPNNSSDTEPAPPWTERCIELFEAARAELPTATEELGMANLELGTRGFQYRVAGLGVIAFEEGAPVGLSQWYWRQDVKRQTWIRGHRNLRGELRGFRDPKSAAFMRFRRAADACLATQEPHLDWQQKGGALLEEPGLQVVPWGNGALLVGEYTAGLVGPNPANTARFEPVVLPRELPREALSFGYSLESHECGEGERMLVMSEGMGYSPDGTILTPTSLYWRLHTQGWSARGKVKGWVAGCGPGWVLLVHVIGGKRRTASYRFETVGDTDRGPRAEENGEAVNGLCEEGPAGKTFLATPEGFVLAGGRRCSTHLPAVEVWPPNTRHGRVKLLRELAVLKAAPQGATNAFSPGHVLPLDGHAVFVDGTTPKRLAPPVEGAHFLTGFGQVAVFRGPHGLIERRPDGALLFASEPQPRHAEVSQPHLTGAARTQGGELWLGWHKQNSQPAFEYFALTQTTEFFSGSE